MTKIRRGHLTTGKHYRRQLVVMLLSFTNVFYKILFQMSNVCYIILVFI